MRVAPFLLTICFAALIAAPGASAFPADTGPAKTVQNDRPPKPQRARPPKPPGRSLLDRWRKMSPWQRRQALQRLTPDRRRQFERRLKELNRMSPEERRRLSREYQQFRRLSPERQEAMRRMYSRLNRLTPDRRQALTQEYRQLRSLPKQQRDKRMESESFRGNFDANERRLLKEMMKSQRAAPEGR